MASERTDVGIAWRLAAIGCLWAALTWAWQRPQSFVVAMICAAVTVWLVVSLVRFVGRSERELARFVESVGHGDLTQRFGGNGVGEALDAAMRRLQDDRYRVGEDARVQAALVERSPTPLLTVGPDRLIGLVNEAARGLFAGKDGRRLDEFVDAGPAFAAVLEPGGPLGRSLVPFATSSGDRRAVVVATEVSRSGWIMRLVSVEPIGRELAAAEVAAQADLVRVLTHEIMNSMTPITSLARSAATLMDKVTDGDVRFADAHRAIGIVAERSEGLLSFVGSYRQYATLPVVRPRPLPAAAWLRSIADLEARSKTSSPLTVAVDVIPANLVLDADANLLAQALLNLLKNAAEAGANRVLLSARGSAEEVEIAVEDNGPGIPTDLVADVFLPFFTSKATGTGIGLSLSRQVAVAHGGTIVAGASPMGGAMFRIVLPRSVSPQSSDEAPARRHH
jgi:signal transduction histidine kinase